MLSASVISQGVRSIAAMLSPEKNPCRVHLTESSGSSSSAVSSSWYRFDPYVSKVLSSPMKTQLISPTAKATTSSSSSASHEGQQLHRNSLFATPVATKKPLVGAAPAPMAPAPVSFMAAAPPVIGTTAPPSPIAVEKKAPAAVHYAVVYFKHDSATFIAPFRIKNGDKVIVEGDRGVDLGVVGDITTTTPKYSVPLKIVRRATATDLEAFEQKGEKEQVVVGQVQALADSLNLGIRIADTEFQFDNNKLTVFFETTNHGNIDFRKLQRGLFRDHRCRIWLSDMAEIEYNANLQKTRRTR